MIDLSCFYTPSELEAFYDQQMYRYLAEPADNIITPTMPLVVYLKYPKQQGRYQTLVPEVGICIGTPC